MPVHCPTWEALKNLLSKLQPWDSRLGHVHFTAELHPRRLCPFFPCSYVPVASHTHRFANDLLKYLQPWDSRLRRVHFTAVFQRFTTCRTAVELISVGSELHCVTNSTKNVLQPLCTFASTSALIPSCTLRFPKLCSTTCSPEDQAATHLLHLLNYNFYLC